MGDTPMLLALLDFYASDSSCFGRGDRELEILVLKALVGLGDIAQSGEDESAHRVVIFVFRQIQLELVVQIVDVRPCVGFDSVFIDLLNRLGRRFLVFGSSRMSSSVTMPAVPPYSSSTTAMWSLRF